MSKKSTIIGASVGTGIGAGIGIGLGNAIAKRKANKLGIKKDSEEYKKMRKSLMIKGGLAGAGAGAITGGAAAHFGSKAYHKIVDPNHKPLDPSKYKKGDIVEFHRNGYSHFAIVADDKGTIIEYTKPGSDPKKFKVVKGNISKVANGDKVTLRSDIKPAFSPDEIVDRATKQLGSDRGGYSLRYNNCETFAREMATGKRESHQVRERLKSPLAQAANTMLDKLQNPAYKGVKTYADKFGTDLLDEAKYRFAMEKGFNVRKSLPKELGGLSKFNRHQTAILGASGTAIGGLVGKVAGKYKAKKKAEQLGLKKDSEEYNDYVKRKSNISMAKGAALGLGVGVAGSIGMDTLRGKLIRDKQLNQGMNLGNNYRVIGKTMRGINSEKDMDKIKSAWKGVGTALKDKFNAL